MAGESPPPVAGPSREITPGIRHLLDSLPQTPAYVVDAAYNVLAWNHLATYFIGDLSGYEDRNMIRWTFRRGPADVIWTDEHFLRFTRATVADLRASYARYPGDAAIESLVTEMLALSPQFAAMWAEHEVEERAPMLKFIDHPQAGPLEFECQVLHIAGTGQRLIVYCAARLGHRGHLPPASRAHRPASLTRHGPFGVKITARAGSGRADMTRPRC